jgi:serine/threonine protein kinase
MAQIDSPFICCLKYAFVTDAELVLVLDLMPGGDLGFHLNKRKRFDIATARYYACRTILAIAYLHSKKIVYRDLKPDNILLDMKGRSYVSDLGLATRVKGSLRGVAGTRGCEPDTHGCGGISYPLACRRLGARHASPAVGRKATEV